MPPVRNNTNQPVAGVSALMLGLFLFSLQDVAIKFFSNSYSILQIFVIRGTVALALCTILVALFVGKKGFVIRSPELALSKGLLAFISYLAYYLAIASMPLADVVAVVLTAPVMVTLMSVVLLRERVGLHRWLAVVVGFAGVLLIVAPGGRIADIAVSLAAIAALTYAMGSIISRYIGPEDRPLTVTFYFSAINLLGGVAVSLLVWLLGSTPKAQHASIEFLLRPWSFGDPVDLAIMMAIGANAVSGFYLLNKAYLSAPASTVAPYEYTYLVWAVLFGYLLWSEIPAPNTTMGVTLLVLANFSILHRELLHRRRLRRQPPVAAEIEIQTVQWGSADRPPIRECVEQVRANVYAPK